MRCLLSLPQIVRETGPRRQRGGFDASADVLQIETKLAWLVQRQLPAQGRWPSGERRVSTTFEVPCVQGHDDDGIGDAEPMQRMGERVPPVAQATGRTPNLQPDQPAARLTPPGPLDSPVFTG